MTRLDEPWPLPQGWIWKRLCDLAELNPGDEPTGNDGDALFVPMDAIGTNGTIETSKRRPIEELRSGSFSRFRAGDVLLARITPSFENGKIGVAPGEAGDEAYGTTEFHVIRPSGTVSAEYLARYLRSPRTRFELSERMTGSAGQQRVRASVLEALMIPVPPYEEQARIVDLFEEADHVEGQANEGRALANSVAQATLEAMFSAHDSEALRPGWKEARLQDIAEVQGGLQVSKKRVENPISVPYLRVANVHRGHMRLEEIKEMRCTRAEIKRVSLRDGDLLLVEGHANRLEVGRSAIWHGSIHPCVHQNHLIRVRLEASIAMPEYVDEFLNSVRGRRQVARFAKTTSGLNTINVGNVKSTRILLPPLDAQIEFSRIVRTATDANAGLEEVSQLAAQLRESLALSAFGHRV